MKDENWKRGKMFVFFCLLSDGLFFWGGGASGVVGDGFQETFWKFREDRDITNDDLKKKTHATFKKNFPSTNIEGCMPKN